jgi:transcriptional regulator with XRE-family HTH domain
MQNVESDPMETEMIPTALRTAPAGEPLRAASPLAAARVHRQLTLEEAARRAGIGDDEAEWLEEGRVYRFASVDRALLAALLYATSLGIDHREARERAGLPVPPLPPQANPRARLALVVGIALAALALGLAVFTGLGPHRASSGAAASASALPPPWRISIRVLNGSGDYNYTRAAASKMQALGYRIAYVGRADNFRYTQTAVYFPPDGEDVGSRLAHQLGVALRPLPGGADPRQLVVIVGPARGPGA